MVLLKIFKISKILNFFVRHVTLPRLMLWIWNTQSEIKMTKVGYVWIFKANKENKHGLASIKISISHLNQSEWLLRIFKHFSEFIRIWIWLALIIGTLARCQRDENPWISNFTATGAVNKDGPHSGRLTRVYRVSLFGIIKSEIIKSRFNPNPKTLNIIDLTRTEFIYISINWYIVHVGHIWWGSLGNCLYRFTFRGEFTSS